MVFKSLVAGIKFSNADSTIYVTLHKFLYLSVPHFFNLYGDYNIYLMQLLEELK